MARAVIGQRQPTLTDHVRGVFGRFTTNGPEQITFVTTQFDKRGLARVSTAREVFPRKHLRVRELIQRDIDDNRVREDIVNYLRPSGVTIGPRFFPPIIIAVFPVDGGPGCPIADLYPTAGRPDGRFPRVSDPGEGGQFYEVWEYGNAMRLRIPLPDPTPARPLEQLDLDKDAIYQGAQFSWDRDNVKLVAIDGQHRLLALKTVFNILNDDERSRGYDALTSSPDVADPAITHVPVCLLIAPELYEGNPDTGGTTLFKVFRQLFVDINKNARIVSKSRNILLDERDAVATFTRNVVDTFLPEAELPLTAVVSAEDVPLYACEIDPPEQREEQINDVRAVTSVGLLNAVITSLLLDEGDSTDRFRTALHIEEGDPELDPEETGKPGESPSDLSHKRFELWQREVLENRFRKEWEPGLVTVLRQLFPAAQLIQTMEEERIRLATERDSLAQKDNPAPGTAYEYLVGSEGDRRQIEYVSNLPDQVGRFVPTACSAAIQGYRQFATDRLNPIRSSPFGRLYFSNVGQQQISEFVFRTLAEYEPELTYTSRAQAWVADFNSTFASSAGHATLFDRNQPWNEPIIKALGTQAYRQKHISGLLMLSVVAFPANGRLEVMYATHWAGMRDDLFGRGLQAIQSVISAHLRRQISQRPDIRVIKAAKAKTQRITDELQRQLAGAFTPLRDLIAGWGGQAAAAATRIATHGEESE